MRAPTCFQGYRSGGVGAATSTSASSRAQTRRRAPRSLTATWVLRRGGRRGAPRRRPGAASTTPGVASSSRCSRAPCPSRTPHARARLVEKWVVVADRQLWERVSRSYAKHTKLPHSSSGGELSGEHLFGHFLGHARRASREHFYSVYFLEGCGELWGGSGFAGHLSVCIPEQAGWSSPASAPSEGSPCVFWCIGTWTLFGGCLCMGPCVQHICPSCLLYNKTR